MRGARLKRIRPTDSIATSSAWVPEPENWAVSRNKDVPFGGDVASLLQGPTCSPGPGDSSRAEEHFAVRRATLGAAPPSAGAPEVYPCRPTSGRGGSGNHQSPPYGARRRLTRSKHGNDRAPATRAPKSPGASRNHYPRATRKQHLAGYDDPRNRRAQPTYPQKWTLAFDYASTRWTSARTDAQQIYHKQDKKATITNEGKSNLGRQSPHSILTGERAKTRATANALAE